MSDDTETPLSRECRELRLDNKRLRKALRWYAEESDGQRARDGGRRARAALPDPKGER